MRLGDYTHADSRVLDLASGPAGSFAVPQGCVIHADLDAIPAIPAGPGLFVRCDSHQLPFAAHSFDLVIAAHCLEHFARAPVALGEVGRVLKPGGILYVTVPDATTLTDRIYRWLYLGGGHVNAFTGPAQVAGLVATHAGLPLRATRTLYSSLSFLTRDRVRQLPRRRRYVFPGLGASWVSLLLALLSVPDRLLGTRLTVYGWEFHFRQNALVVEFDGDGFVCSQCGAACSGEWLRHRNAFRVWQLCFRCPDCDTFNFAALRC